MDSDTSCALLVFLAFVVGAGAQSLPNAARLTRMANLLESLASFLGQEHGKGDDPEPKRKARRHDPRPD